MASTAVDRAGRTAALGFATAVTMWGVAYVGRLPAVMAPSWMVLVALLAVVVGWGYYAGRATGRWTAGAAAGAMAAIVNLLILGSLLAHPDDGVVRPAALLWLPLSLLALSGLAAAAALAGAGRSAERRGGWGALLTKVGVAATFLLVVAGGLVTSHEAGLAVVDWPRTFGVNMFLYPLARMTGGVYFEHAHRLFGALVGLTTIVVAWHLVRNDGRRWIRQLAWSAVVLVIVQGLLGGLRVTGRFTLSQSPEDMAPSIAMAVAHGVLGQLFLAVMVVLACATSRLWGGAGEARPSAGVGADHGLQALLVGVLVVQLVLGAIQRHLAQGLLVHIVMATVVTIVALAVGVRAWGLHGHLAPLGALGRLLMAGVAIQVALGIAALAVTGGQAVVGAPTAPEVTLATAHQAFGAVLLGLSVALAAWTRRRLAATPPSS